MLSPYPKSYPCLSVTQQIEVAFEACNLLAFQRNCQPLLSNSDYPSSKENPICRHPLPSPYADFPRYALSFGATLLRTRALWACQRVAASRSSTRKRGSRPSRTAMGRPSR